MIEYKTIVSFFFLGKAWKPGDLNQMFERIAHGGSWNRRYNITILSRPFKDAAESRKFKDLREDTNQEPMTLHGIGGPWVIMIENFLSEGEANRLIELGGLAGYERSYETGDVLENGYLDDVISNHRTSMNAWCHTDECMDDPVTLSVQNRMEALTGIPMSNSESIQLLRYETGQYYKVHHDYLEDEYDRIQGVRILTIFLYLNTISHGGGTNFPKLDLTVTPKVGRAVVWPSVLNKRPHHYDRRTYHQSLPVLGANETKYGANVWIHQRHILDNCP
jgi:prolyl 4-hydroxylase